METSAWKKKKKKSLCGTRERETRVYTPDVWKKEYLQALLRASYIHIFTLACVVGLYYASTTARTFFWYMNEFLTRASASLIFFLLL